MLIMRLLPKGNAPVAGGRIKGADFGDGLWQLRGDHRQAALDAATLIA